MPFEFVAIGPHAGQSWRRPMPTDQTVRLGRAPQEGWAVPWDMRVSREHADLRLEGDRVQVTCLSSARNAAVRQGQAVKEFTVGAGEDFRIGGTTFRVDHAESADTSVKDRSEITAFNEADVGTVAALKQRLMQMEAQLNQAEEQAATAEKKALRAELAQLKSEEQAQEALDKAIAQITRLQQDVLNAREAQKSAETECLAMKKTLEALNAKLPELREQPADEATGSRPQKSLPPG